MRTGEEYRAKAVEFLEAAQFAYLDRRARLIDMALSYLRLAELADKNSATDIVYETPAPSSTVTQ
jgi:hypothetical protein